MGNEGSQLPSADGTRTPMSDSGLALGATPREVPRVRRYSSASTQPPSPVEAPDLDMSHLSDAEKSQIEAVISRARELQAEEARRVREIEEEFGPLSASVPVNLSDVGPAARCAECKDVELKGEMQNVCVECELTVCLNCGVYETNPTTKLQQWFCSTCNERRHLTSDVTMWCNGRQEASDFDTFLDMDAVDMPIGRGMMRTTSLTKPLLDAAESGVEDIRDVSDPEVTADMDPTYSRGGENGDIAHKRDIHAASQRGDNRQRQNSKAPLKEKPVPPPKPDLSRRGSRESRDSSPAKHQSPGVDQRTGRQDNHTSRTRGVGQSPDSERDSHVRQIVHALDAEALYHSFEEEEAVSPGGTRRKQRPQHLTLNRQHSAGSTASTSSSDSYVLVERDRPTGESVGGKQLDVHKMAQDQRSNEVKAQPRTGAEGAEGTHSTGTIKKKPSALDRVGITDTIDPDRNQSPSRRSPKSPPRSPSWMRYRDSPPRSPPIYSISPSMSPTERFPSPYVERTSPSYNREETYGEETGPPSARDHTAFNFDQYEMNSFTQNDLRNHPDRPPPKPARLSGPYQFDNGLAPHSLDLATYAATVASDTAHLTNMSVSPTCNLQVPDSSGEQEYLEVSPEQESLSPPSPNYYDDVEDELEVSEPTPKSIDYQNTKRQRVKPPASDWSPVTDLSPILDVSPSIERLEQEKMLAEQTRCDADLLFDSPPCTIKRRPKPQALVEPQSATFPNDKADNMTSPLKRYQAFDDISKLSSSGEQKNRNSQNLDPSQPEYVGDSVTPDLIHSVQNIKDKAKEADEYFGDVPQQNMKNMERMRGEPPVRPDLCTGKDGSAKDDTAWVRKRIPVREDPRDSKEGTTDQGGRETERRTRSDNDGYSSLTADDSHLLMGGRRGVNDGDDQQNRSQSPQVTRAKVGVNSSRDRTAHQVHGDFERSSSTESTKSKDSASSASKIQSPGSPSDPSKKIRRKLPPVPPEVESPTNSTTSRSRSQTPTDAKPDPVAVEKERLRKKLQEKEAEKRRKEKETPTRPVSSLGGSSRSVVDAGSQTKEEEDEMMAKRSAVMSTGTNTAPGSPQLHMNSCNGKLKARPPVGSVKKPPKPPPKPKIEMVNIRGILVPSDVKSLKQRIKEEMQIATASRRLHIDEMEEIRLMERELAEREKDRRQKAADDALYEVQLKAVRMRERELEQMKELDKLRKMENEIAANEQKLRAEARRKTPSGSYLTALRMSPQASPRRARHKRQNSDPMVAKFSPIEEVRDIESDLSYKLGLEARRLASNLGRFSPKTAHTMRRHGSVTPPGASDLSDLTFRQASLARSSLSRSSEALSKFSLVERDARLATSQSESDLLMSLTDQDALAYFGEEEDWRLKEERKHVLQMEIEKRKRAMDENARLQDELRRLSESADISRHELEDAKVRYQQYMRNKERVPTGIIKPIDYDMEFRDAEAYSQMEYAAYREMLERLQQERFVPPHPSFASSDYLAHQRDRPPKQGMDALLGLGPTGEYLMADMWAEGRYPPPGDQPGHPEMHGYQPVKISGRMHGSQMAPHYVGMKDSDPLNQIYRAESEHSLAESDDVMEGGVTLRRETEKKVQPPSQESTPTQQRKYDFPTKRILLTRDPKERSVKGKHWNGIGMKIVGGKVLPGHDNEMGAYVSAIYPGGVADQLHGELQEGDQVLEWNGIVLTGKTYEEVQRIILMPNGEIELVVRPGANLCNKHSETMSTLRSDSCHSSYDNLEITTSDYEELDRYLDSGDGIDPDVLAAQLEDIRHDPMSPGASPSSSQQEMYHTPSMSTPVSSDPTDPPSPPMEVATMSPGNQQHLSSGADEKPPIRKRAPGDKSLGEIQLQLSYDDYDGTLNIHVIQARNLRPKDKNGYSDPFVKVYLLPQRIAENKRRTKYIARTLDPEWHQTLVFMKISHDDLVTKTLEITVWDYDRFKPNDFLGEVFIDLNVDVFLDNKPHWYKLHEHTESTNAKMAKPPTLSPAPSSSSSTRSVGGRGGSGRGAAGRGGIVGGPGHGVQSQNQMTRGGQPQGDNQSRARGAHHAPTGTGQAQNHVGHGRGQGQGHREGQTHTTSRSRDPSSDPRDPSEQFQSNTRTASPRSQKSKQTLSSSEQGATKYSPGLGRKPLGADSKEIVETTSASDVKKPTTQAKKSMSPSKSSDSCKSEKLKSDLVSMATLPISLTAAALATTFVVKSVDHQKSPVSTSSSSFSFTEIYAVENSPPSVDTPVRKKADSVIPSAYPPIVGDDPVPPSAFGEVFQTGSAVTSPPASVRRQTITLKKVLSAPETDQPISPDVAIPRSPRKTTRPSSEGLDPDKAAGVQYVSGSGGAGRPLSLPGQTTEGASDPAPTSGGTARPVSMPGHRTEGASGPTPTSGARSPPTLFLLARDHTMGLPGDQPFQFHLNQPVRSAVALRDDAPMTTMGEILVGLREDPDYKLLSVAVVHCRSMAKSVGQQGNKDWYVKLLLRPISNPSQVKKRKTGTQRALLNPAFNEIFHFETDVNVSLLDIILCIQTGRIQKDRQMGKFRIDLRGMKKTTVPKKELFRYYAFGPIKR